MNALSGRDLRGLRAQRAEHSANRLMEALENLRLLRGSFPQNPAFASTEVHIRHKFASVFRKLGSIEKAETEIDLAIDIQSTLVETYPDSVSYRGRRALLYRSLAQIRREQGNEEGSEKAIQQALNDAQEIPDEFSNHPFVERVQKSISDFSNQ